MEGDLIPSGKDISMTEAFEAACSLFLTFGMTYDEFWYGDPVRAKYYREAHDIAMEQMSFNAFIQGKYVRDAISDFMEFYTMTAKPKIRHNFPDEPYPVTKKGERLAKERKEEEVAKSYLKMLGAKKHGNND